MRRVEIQLKCGKKNFLKLHSGSRNVLGICTSVPQNFNKSYEQEFTTQTCGEGLAGTLRRGKFK